MKKILIALLLILNIYITHAQYYDFVTNILNQVDNCDNNNLDSIIKIIDTYKYFRDTSDQQYYLNKIHNAINIISTEFDFTPLPIDSTMSEKEIEKIEKLNKEKLNQSDDYFFGGFLSAYNEINYCILYKDTVYKYSDKIVPNTFKTIFEYNLGAEDCFEILGWCNLPDSTAQKIINHPQCPIYVKAKLGDQTAKDSIFNMYLAYVNDTTKYNYPTNEETNLVEHLFYIDTPEAWEVFFKGLNTNKMCYKINDYKTSVLNLPDSVYVWEKTTLATQLIWIYMKYYNNSIYFYIIPLYNNLKWKINFTEAKKLITYFISDYLTYKHKAGCVSDKAFTGGFYTYYPPTGEPLREGLYQALYPNQYGSFSEIGIWEEYKKIIGKIKDEEF